MNTEHLSVFSLAISKAFVGFIRCLNQAQIHHSDTSGLQRAVHSKDIRCFIVHVTRGTATVIDTECNPTVVCLEFNFFKWHNLQLFFTSDSPEFCGLIGDLIVTSSASCCRLFIVGDDGALDVSKLNFKSLTAHSTIILFK
jgi:hypothetical protein